MINEEKLISFIRNIRPSVLRPWTEYDSGYAEALTDVVDFISEIIDDNDTGQLSVPNYREAI